MEKYNKLDLVVNSYITELSFKKTASHFGYNEVESEDEMSTSSEMVAAMVKLPKYDQIRNRIKNASGIVNFVTSNEYAPLVEFLLKSALPPTNNDVFNRGFQATLPSDYFIDSKYFASDIRLAVPELEEIIRGSKKKISSEWIKQQGWDINDIDQHIVLPNGPEDEVIKISEIIKQYETALRLLTKDPLVNIINKLWSELQKDNDARVEIKLLENNKDSKSVKRIKELQAFVLSGEDKKQKMNQLVTNRNTYRRKVLAIKNSSNYSMLNLSEDFSGGVPAYEDNGFMSWNPVSKISANFHSLLNVEDEYKERKAQEESETKRRIANLIQLLSEYRTSDRELMIIRNKILELFGEEREYYINFRNNCLKITALAKAFVEKGRGHGKVLIFSNVENSAIVKKEIEEGRETLSLNDPSGIFSDFSDLNDINENRDLQEKLEKRGKRTIVFISSSPINNLPKGSVIVRIDSSPVDEAEAKIIVSYLIAPYVEKATRAIDLKKLHSIEEKYKGKLDASSQEQKDRENGLVEYEIEKMKDSIAYISPEGRETLEQLIFQMGQKEAIATVKGTLASNAKFVKSEDGILENITFNEEEILKEMIDESNRRKTEGKLGLVCRKPKVKFEQYITKKNSEWGKIVGNLGITIKDIDFKNREIVSIRKKITSLDVDLMNQRLSSQTRAEKIKLRDSLELELDRLYSLKKGYLKEMPHFTVLWGKPGVGKCLGRGTPVIMFDGSIKNVEDVKVDDLLMGPDSKPRKVLTAISGVGPLYRIEQNNGDDYICNNTHILSLQNTELPEDQQPIFISAEDYCQKNKTWKHRHKGWKVGIEFPEQELPIDPYWMGLWLGDGTSRLPAITIGDKDPEISNWLLKWAKKINMFIRKEEYVDKACETWNFTSVQGKKHVPTNNAVKTNLRNLNLLQNKHIPEIYWKNSSKNRLELLAGLIDSDGYMTKTGSIQFTNVNKKLAQSVLWLARSVGLRATLAEGIKGIKKINYTVKAYTVTIGGKLSKIPTKLPRKQGHDNPQKKALRCGINVKPIGDGEYFGFTIDGDHQFLLGDFTVTHNSIYADALADIGKFMIYNVEIGQVKSKFIGETSKFTRELLNTIFSSRNAVYLLDEIDRMMEMSEGSQGTASDGGRAHETTKDIVSQFLARFEDDRRTLIDRNIFVIMTTNNLSAIDTALLSRTRGNVKQVEASDDPKDYLKYLQTFLETEKRDVPNDPWIKDFGVTEEEQWAYTFDFFKNKLDLEKVSQVFAEKKLGFRDLSGMLKELCRNNNIWKVGKSAIERGETLEVHGLPLTTQNVMRAAKLTVDTSGGNAEAKSGVDMLVLETSMRVEKLLKSKKLEETTDASGNKVFKLPKDVLEVLDGKAENEEIDQFTVEQVDDPNSPTGKAKRLQKTPPTKPSIKELDSTGFKDVTSPTPKGKEESEESEEPQEEVVQQTIPAGKQKKEKPAVKENPTIEANTTDYLYNFLKKAKVIDADDILKSVRDLQEKERLEKQAQNNVTKTGIKPVTYEDELARNGVYYCNNNQVLIAPLDSRVPLVDSQRLKFKK